MSNETTPETTSETTPETTPEIEKILLEISNLKGKITKGNSQIANLAKLIYSFDDEKKELRAQLDEIRKETLEVKTEVFAQALLEMFDEIKNQLQNKKEIDAEPSASKENTFGRKLLQKILPFKI